MSTASGNLQNDQEQMCEQMCEQMKKGKMRNLRGNRY